MRTHRWSVASTTTRSTRPITTLTSCLRRYAVVSPPVRSARWLVADQTSSVPRVTSASTASISTQSSRGTFMSVPLGPGGRRQDRAVAHERRQPARRRGGGDGRLLRVHLGAADAVQRPPPRAHGGTDGARAGACLGHHHDDHVVLVVR